MKVSTRQARARARREPILLSGVPEAAAAVTPWRTRRYRRFSSLTRRILAINLLALGIVVGGFIYLDQYQRGLIEGRLEALATQGLIIAAALGETAVPRDPTVPQRIDAERARELIEPLVLPVRSRARVFQNDGELIVDSSRLALARSRVEISELPPPEYPGPFDPMFDWFYDMIDRALIGDLPHYVEASYQRAEHYAEAVRALRGEIGAQARLDADRNMVLNVAVPVRRFKAVLGALMLTAGTEDIESRVRETRADVLMLSLVAVAVTVLLSLYLAGTITRPIRQLAAGAERVTIGHGRAEEIPDLSRRDDDIGDLSTALRAMTDELHQRLDAIEGFAADVAHELKNPLSSLRSAVETMQRVGDDVARQKLLVVLADDVARMDRLITDISAASRLDAELTRATMSPVDLVALLETLVEVRRASGGGHALRIDLVLEQEGPVDVRGIEDRLGQVFRNLIDNAVTFSPPGGVITVRLSRRRDCAVVTFDDEGPGLPPGKIEAIFERFYSERPAGEKFGTHSGLGLSISRQIVEAHHGALRAENRAGAEPGSIAGARFVVWLPF
jgi:two-component system sensor histidine kinase ChvG